MAKKGKQYVYWLIWLGFVLFLLYQHSLVWMHIDDFGYASLNYAVNVGTVGNDYTVADVFKYLYLHYMEWGGRVLFYGIAIFIYHFCGLHCRRVRRASVGRFPGCFFQGNILFGVSHNYQRSKNRKNSHSVDHRLFVIWRFSTCVG